MTTNTTDAYIWWLTPHQAKKIINLILNTNEAQDLPRYIRDELLDMQDQELALRLWIPNGIAASSKDIVWNKEKIICKKLKETEAGGVVFRTQDLSLVIQFMIRAMSTLIDRVGTITDFNMNIINPDPRKG